jgi:hypothetical protein
MRVTLWLTIMIVFWVSKDKPRGGEGGGGGLPPEKEKAYSKANTVFCGAVVGVLAESLLKRCGIP